MAKTLEELAEEIYKEALEDGEEVTKEEALEMARMEMGAKDIKNYTQAAPEKKERKPRERKVDEDKGFLLDEVKTALTEVVDSAIEVETETCLHFDFNGNRYTLKLTKHRPKKGETK